MSEPDAGHAAVTAIHGATASINAEVQRMDQIREDRVFLSQLRNRLAVAKASVQEFDLSIATKKKKMAENDWKISKASAEIDKLKADNSQTALDIEAAETERAELAQTEAALADLLRRLNGAAA